jgi:hypothetical protein
VHELIGDQLVLLAWWMHTCGGVCNRMRTFPALVVHGCRRTAMALVLVLAASVAKVK